MPRPPPRRARPGPVPPGDPALSYRGPDGLRQALVALARGAAVHDERPWIERHGRLCQKQQSTFGWRTAVTRKQFIYGLIGLAAVALGVVGISPIWGGPAEPWPRSRPPRNSPSRSPPATTRWAIRPGAGAGGGICRAHLPGLRQLGHASLPAVQEDLYRHRQGATTSSASSRCARWTWRSRRWRAACPRTAISSSST